MPVKAVVFDIGGVLEANPRTGWQGRWAQRLGMQRAEFDARVEPIWGPGTIGDTSLEEIERQLAAALTLKPSAVTQLMDEAWTGNILGTLNHDLADYFAALRPAYTTGMLSNSFVGAREREQRAYGFEDMCDAIVYSHEIGYLKPDPRSYRHACDRLGVAPDQAILVDDVQANVDGARAVGMKALRFDSTELAIAELERRLAAP